MHRTAIATALTVAGLAAPAWADLTPQDVWAAWQAGADRAGVSMTADAAVMDDALILRDLTITQTDPFDEGTEDRLEVVMDTVRLNAIAGGGARVEWPATIPLTLILEDGGGTVTVDLTHRDTDFTVSGTADALDYAIESARVTLGNMVLEGDAQDDMGGIDATVDIAAGPVTSLIEVDAADGFTTTTQSHSIGEATYLVDSGVGWRVEGTHAGIEARSTTTMPQGVDGEDIFALLEAGYRLEGRNAHDGGSIRIRLPGLFRVTTMESAGTTVSSALSAKGFDLSYDLDSFAIDLGGADLPDLPDHIGLAADRLNLVFRSALDGTERAGSTADLSLDAQNLAVDPSVWDYYDPGAALPRDPITLLVEMAAVFTPAADLTQPGGAMRMMMADMPAQIDSLTLSNLMLSGLGGMLRGEGAFTFDNTDLSTFDGIPRPEGSITLDIEGLNGLIDALIQMGVISQDDAMGARMMLSMFTVPGSVPDTATSELRIMPNGNVLANGQRIR